MFGKGNIWTRPLDVKVFRDIPGLAEAGDWIGFDPANGDAPFFSAPDFCGQ